MVWIERGTWTLLAVDTTLDKDNTLFNQSQTDVYLPSHRMISPRTKSSSQFTCTKQMAAEFFTQVSEQLLKGHHHRSHSSEEAMIVEVAKLEREEKMYLLDMALFFVFQTTRSWKERKLTVHSTWPSWMLPKEPTDSHLWSLSTRKLIPFTTPSRHVPFFLVVFGFLVLILFTLIYVSI